MTSNIAPIRWKSSESRRARVFDPLGADHPAAAATCVFCDQQIGTTTPVQIVVVGPDLRDDENRERHEAGRWYSALGVLVHEPCADALDDTQLERVIGELVQCEEE